MVLNKDQQDLKSGFGTPTPPSNARFHDSVDGEIGQHMISAINNYLRIMVIVRLDTLLILLCLCLQVSAGSWWLLSKIQAASLHSTGEIVCKIIPGYMKRQRSICQKNPELFHTVSHGARLGIDQCQEQFKNHRWNCSTVEAGSSAFGKMVQKGYREAAFLYAISSAGVAHAVTKSCSRGDVPGCTCDPDREGASQDAEGRFKWGGCSEYVGFGVRFARQFVDASEGDGRDARALMNLHNNRAGRKAVQKLTKRECKCHGVSGSCASRTCWLTLQEFQRVGKHLKRKYDGAVQVAMHQPGMLLAVENRKPFTKADIIYFEPSPDYCDNDTRTGSLGTAGRSCKKNSLGTDGCDIMCCGRGYDTKRVVKKIKCRCRFHYCCHVECEECIVKKDVYTCKSHT